MDEPDKPGFIWYLTLMAAAIKEVDPLDLEKSHKAAMVMTILTYLLTINLSLFLLSIRRCSMATSLRQVSIF